MDASKENEKNCDVTALNATTKVGLTFGQIISLVVIVFTFSMSYASLNTRIADIEQKQTQFEVVIKDVVDNNKTADKNYQEIKQSLIRIEGKLDLKQDRFK